MGAVLSVNNIRPAGDIDIIFDPSIEPLLREKGFVYQPTATDEKFKTRYVSGNIEAFPAFYNIGTLRECRKKYRMEFVDGIPFMSLADTLLVKKLFSRPKDLLDVATA